MKRCPKCGLVQEDRRACVDCGAVLGKSLPKDEAERLQNERAEQIEEMSERCTEFYVSPRRRAFGISGIAISVLCAVALWLASGYAKNADGAVICAWIGLVCGIYGAIALLLPRFVWKLETLRFSMRIDGELSPSDTYMVWSTIAAYAAWGISAVMAAFSVLRFFVK